MEGATCRAIVRQVIDVEGKCLGGRKEVRTQPRCCRWNDLEGSATDGHCASEVRIRREGQGCCCGDCRANISVDRDNTAIDVGDDGSGRDIRASDSLTDSEAGGTTNCETVRLRRTACGDGNTSRCSAVAGDGRGVKPSGGADFG